MEIAHFVTTKLLSTVLSLRSLAFCSQLFLMRTSKMAAALQEHNDRFQAHGDALLTQIRDDQQQARADNQQRLAAITERFQEAGDATAEGWRRRPLGSAR